MPQDSLNATFTAMIPNFDLNLLLTRLNAGSDARLFSVANWQAQLGRNPAADWFIEHLEAEWKPAQPLDDLCKQAFIFVKSRLLESPGGAAIWAHTLRVTGNALMIAPDAGIPPQTAYLLAILHDVSKLESGIESHEALGGRAARAFLTNNLSEDEIAAIVKVISKRGKNTMPLTQLLHDADKLDKLGATGICRRISALGTDAALVRLRTELVAFPILYFPAAQALADEKRAFTTQFFALVDRA